MYAAASEGLLPGEKSMQWQPGSCNHPPTGMGFGDILQSREGEYRYSSSRYIAISIKHYGKAMAAHRRFRQMGW